TISGSRAALIDRCSAKKRKKRNIALIVSMLLLLMAGGAVWWSTQTDAGKLELAEVQVSLQTMNLSGTDARLIESFQKEGDLYMKTGQFKKAVDAYRQVCDGVKPKHGENSIEYLEALGNVISAEDHLPGSKQRDADRQKFELLANGLLDIPFDLMKE